MDSQTLLQQALVLPENERLRLVEGLLESLPPESEESDEAFHAELRRRSEEIEQGQAELISWDHLKNEKD
jgi:putative addiction module component (TIGR02574 family)